METTEERKNTRVGVSAGEGAPPAAEVESDDYSPSLDAGLGGSPRPAEPEEWGKTTTGDRQWQRRGGTPWASVGGDQCVAPPP